MMIEREVSSQNKIIEAAIKVFAQYGYDKASTTLIAKAAGLSKGLIFHYFGNKSDLYAATYQSAVEIMINELMDKINYDQPDMLLRLRESVQLKLQLMQDFPDIFEFVKIAYYEQPPELRDKFKQINADLLDQSMGKLYQNIDYSLFRPDVNVGLAMTTINNTLEKWSENYVQSHYRESLANFDPEDTLVHLDAFLKLFRTCFYKEAAP